MSADNCHARHEAYGDPAAFTSWLALLVLQPSPFCNINCDYCYLPSRQDTRRMSMDTLRRVFGEVMESDLVRDTLTVVWHAGEPMAVPIAWYTDAFRVIAEHTPPGLRIRHSFQSNGTLINPAWCEFVRRNDISIGLSIDGPESLHDRHRKTRKGAGTHVSAMRGVRLLQEYGIPFHVISVVTAEALGRADEIFDFFVGNGMCNLAFNIEETEGVHEKSTLEKSDIEEKVRCFFQRIFERQKAETGRVRVREFDSALHRIRSGKPACHDFGLPTFNEQTRPFGILSVDWQGGFSTYSPELLGLQSDVYGDFAFGSLATDSLAQSVQTPKFRRVLDDIREGLEICRRTCAYFELCGGGAPANKYFENGTFASGETMFCKYAIQLPIDIVLADLEQGRETATSGRRERQTDLMR